MRKVVKTLTDQEVEEIRSLEIKKWLYSDILVRVMKRISADDTETMKSPALEVFKSKLTEATLAYEAVPNTYGFSVSDKWDVNYFTNEAAEYIETPALDGTAYLTDQLAVQLERPNYIYCMAVANLAQLLVMEKSNSDIISDERFVRYFQMAEDASRELADMQTGVAGIILGEDYVMSGRAFKYDFDFDSLSYETGDGQIVPTESIYVTRPLRTVDEFTEWLAVAFPDISEHLSAEKKPMGRTVTFQVTDGCNLRCVYCYQINKGHREMSFETAKKLIDALLDENSSVNDYLENPPGIVLDFIGGDPLLEIGLIDKCVDYFYSRCMELNHPWAIMSRVSLCTNGVLYFSPETQAVLQKQRDRISINVTVDGTKELHDSCRLFPDGKGSYDYAHKAAMAELARNKKADSKITLAPGNVEYFSDCFKQMLRDGYYSINANPVFEDVWLYGTSEKYKYPKILWQEGVKFVKWFLDSDHKPDEFTGNFFEVDHYCPADEDSNNNYCGGTGNMLAMDPDGTLYPCLRYMESSVGTEVPAMIIGNIDDGIAVTPETKKRCDDLNAITRRSQSTDECFYCPIGRGCGNCSAYNYQKNGTADCRGVYHCEMVKSIALINAYFWNSCAEKFHDPKYADDLWVPEQWAVPIIGKDAYDELVDLTLRVGRFVNRDKTIVHDVDWKSEAEMMGEGDRNDP